MTLNVITATFYLNCCWICNQCSSYQTWKRVIGSATWPGEVTSGISVSDWVCMYWITLIQVLSDHQGIWDSERSVSWLGQVRSGHQVKDLPVGSEVPIPSSNSGLYCSGLTIDWRAGRKISGDHIWVQRAKSWEQYVEGWTMGAFTPPAN